MSSTNRSDARNKHISDYYVTPKEAIKTFLACWLGDLQGEHNNSSVADNPDKQKWLDPCAGGDAKHQMSYPAVLEEELGVYADTVDLREDSLAKLKQNYFLTEVEPNYYDVIITNPPFNQAKAIIEKALNDVRDGGYVVMLLRLNFLGSKDRYEFWEKQLPTWIYVHHKRMSFTDDGKTDSIEYTHMVWQKGANPSFSMLKII